MSNRDSMGFGDLIPQDVVDIFAHEKHTKRGRKQRSHSLGRALGWLKGKKKKDVGTKAQNLGLGPALDLALDGQKGGIKSGRHTHPQGNSHAVPKIRDDDKTPAPPHLQENVFAEASRPKYLEDLHSEALEGLKLMQQEETSNGVEFPDNESTISTMDVQTDGESTGFMTDSTIADSSSVVSAKSSISNRSSRSGLTRQASTFRPLNSENKSEKKKTRRRHRKSVEGIPKHVQKELGLDRVGWILNAKLNEEEIHNGEILPSPTSEGPSNEQGSGSTLGKDLAEQGGTIHAGHKDDLALLHHLGPELAGGPRPRSVAVPSMTTANSLQEPPSPVITTSPQAAYMSKIIPNAVLPPSIEVVEISRGRSRSSLRTVSKSSLVHPSPAPSRASSRASSTRTISSRESSAYPQTSNNPTDSSGWSNSDSSETLVSDSSTISSSSTPRQRSQDEVDNHSLKGSTSKSTKNSTNGKVVSNGDGTFTRSLSVMKPKRAPPPPSRSYSLHKAKRRSRDLADLRVVTGASPLQSISASGEENEKSAPGSTTVDSPGYNGDISSLDDSPGSLSPYESKIFTNRDVLKDTKMQLNPLTNTVSPSSGYSSQDCTSPQGSKQLQKKGIFAKLQKLFPGTSPVAPSSIKQTEALESKENQRLLVDPASLSPSVRALAEIFNIPPHPRVHAPPPPPPEVWVHSRRSVELLLGPPVPDNIPAIIKKNPKDRRQLRISSQSEGSARGPAVKTKVVRVEKVNGKESVLLNDSEKQSNEKMTEKVDLNGNRRVIDEKVRASEMLNEMLVKRAEKRDERITAVKVDETRRNTGIKAELVPPISLVRRSPSPSPPPSHHPPQPPGKQAVKVKAVVVSPESSWPPPPPPVAEALSGQDELDFPFPPPPVVAESLVVPVAVPVSNPITGPTTIPIVITECLQEPSTSQGAVVTVINIPPPPSYSAPPPPVKVVSPVVVKKVLLSPVPEIVPQEEPKDISPPPDATVASSTPTTHPHPHESSQETSEELSTVNKVICPPPMDITPVPPKAPLLVKEQTPKENPREETLLLEVVKLNLPSNIVAPEPIDVPKESPPPQSPTVHTVQEVLPTVVTVAAPAPESPPPQVIEVSCVPPVGQTLYSSGDTPEEPASELTGLQPPQSIPPPPPIEPTSQENQSLTQVKELDPDNLEQNTIASVVETVVPGPAVIKAVLPSSVTTSQNTEVTILPEPVAPTQPSAIQQEPETSPTPEASPRTDKTPKQSVTPAAPQAPVSNSLLDMVKLRSAPEATKEAQVASTTNEAPQKPIRKSLILISPSSPPAIITTEPPVHKSPPLVINAPVSTTEPPVPKPQPLVINAPVSTTEPPVPKPQPLVINAPSSTTETPVPKSPPLVINAPSSTTEPPVPKSPPLVINPPSSTSLPPTTTETPVPKSPSLVINAPSSTTEPLVAKSLPLVSHPPSSTSLPPATTEPPVAKSPSLVIHPPFSTSIPPATSEPPVPKSPSPVIHPPSSTGLAPAITEPPVPKSPSLVIHPPSSTSFPPATKSPSAVTPSPSMNLQEVIRMRTAARSKESPGSRISLPPTSPMNLRRSPTSTASFIFSKSHLPVSPPAQKPAEVFSKISEAESQKKVVKVPPPVAKKPKSKVEASEEEHATGGQSDGDKAADSSEKTNGRISVAADGT